MIVPFIVLDNVSLYLLPVEGVVLCLQQVLQQPHLRGAVQLAVLGLLLLPGDAEPLRHHRDPRRGLELAEDGGLQHLRRVTGMSRGTIYKNII